MEPIHMQEVAPARVDDSKGYRVIMVRTDIPGCNELMERIEPSFSIAKGAYATELSLLTGEPVRMYRICSNGEPETYCLAVDQDNIVVGFALLEYEARSRTLWTCHVYVRPEVRHRGVYKNMIERIKRFAKDAGMDRIFSIVHMANRTSICAHKKVGFQRQWVGFEIKENSDAKK